MKKQDFFYELPESLIAQKPLADRSSSKLMLLDKLDGSIRHHIFKDITGFLNQGDCLVINDTKVIPARLFGERIHAYNMQADNKQQKGALIELLLLKRHKSDVWETLVKPGKKARIGTKIVFGDGILHGEIIGITEEGNRFIKFFYNGIFEEILDMLGQMPLPPYITQVLEDKNRYQTIYAKWEGSAAAPTAGLHFTDELMQEIKAKGVKIANVTLHVGLGTFRPVKEENILNHHMHSEFYQVLPDEAEKINTVKKNGGRIICVGTTSCRTIESSADEYGIVKPGSGDTDIFIFPGYKFKVLDALITNFHLPESTLLMLISALAGREQVLAAYAEAVKEKYRFFSFGDAMLIV